MIKLEPVPFEEKVYKDRIKKVNGTAKQGRENLHANYNEIINQISTYTDLEGLTPLSETIHGLESSDLKLLYNFYDNNSFGFGDLKDTIKILTIENPLTKKGLKCPYCGINRHELHDLDHFIPRSKFEEFSILSNNLVYSCSVCNQDYKKAKFKTQDNKRIFLHPYFDEALENTQILECQIDVRDVYLKVNFKICDDLQENDLYIYEIATTHLAELDLNDRYCRLIRDDLLEGFLNIFRNKNTTGNRCIKELSEDECIDYIEQELDKLCNVNQNDFELLFWQKLKLCTDWFTNISGKEL